MLYDCLTVAVGTPVTQLEHASHSWNTRHTVGTRVTQLEHASHSFVSLQSHAVQQQLLISKSSVKKIKVDILNNLDLKDGAQLFRLKKHEKFCQYLYLNYAPRIISV